jgi:flavodoxin
MNITIIYSSWGGNTKLVVDKITETLQEQTIHVEIIPASIATPADLTSTKYILLAAPTYDHGILHAPMDCLLLSAQEVDLSKISFAIVWLWDEKYDQEYTIEAALILEAFVTQQWGTLLHESLKINKSPVDKLNLVQDRTLWLVKNIQNKS